MRWRPDQRACPVCHSSLVVEERAVSVGGIDEIVLWVPSRRLCPQGCHLTLSDFPDGDLD